MDEKELIRRIKNSLRVGKSDNEIILFLQNSGYKLDYATILLKKAKRGKHVLMYCVVFLVIFSVILFLSFLGSNLLSFSDSPQDEQFSGEGGNSRGGLRNPLEGLTIIFDKKPTSDGVASFSNDSLVEESVSNTSHDLKTNEVYVEDIDITTEFITFLMYGLGANELKSNPVTRSKPLINFDIDGKGFYSVVDSGTVHSYDGFGENPDISFSSTKVAVVRAMISETPIVVFKESYNDGTTELIVEKNEATLFAKGYLSFYESLYA